MTPLGPGSMLPDGDGRPVSRGRTTARRRQQWLVATAAVLALAGSACGSQVDADIRRRAWAAAAGGGQPGVAAGQPGGGLGGSAAGGGVSASAGGGTGGAATEAGTAGPGGSGTASGGDNGSGASGGNGGATDVGVTANSITLGNVVDLSGPRPGLFESAAAGTQAYFAYVNSRGGVDGRQLKLTVTDSKTDCAATQNQYRRLSDSVFAFVGSLSLYDNCAVDVLEKKRDMAMVGYGFTGQAKDFERNFSPLPVPYGAGTGPYTYYKNKLGDDVQHVGSLYANIPSVVTAWKGYKAAAESVGWKIVYERAHGVQETDFTADVVRMQRAGVQVVYIAADDVLNAARIKKAADQQNWHPTWIMPLTYDSSFIELMGGPEAAEGVLGNSAAALFFNESDAQRIPAVRNFQIWMHRTSPDARMDAWAMLGWSAGALFVEALQDAGPKVTREKLLAELGKVHEFDADGLLIPTNPAGKKPSNCYVLWRIHDGRYKRVDSPAKGFRCDGHFYYYKGG